MSRHARWEIVRSDAGHFARFIAANGREVWRTSEVYTRRQGALNAALLIGVGGLEVRDVDERGRS